MAVRYFADHITDTGIRVRVDIHDSLFSGTSSKLKGTGSDWLSYTHQLLEPSQYVEIQNGELSCGVFVQTATHETLRNDIISSSEGRFELYLYFDGVFEWKGTVLPDLCSYTEDTPERFYVTAKDFSILKKDLFALSTTRETIITTIEDILSDFSLPIITATSWTESNTTSTNDFLRQIYHERTALREFTDADNTDIQITNEEALRWILRGYGLTLKQSGGALRIDQFSEYETPKSVLLSTYNSGFVSQATTDVTQIVPVFRESDNKPNAGIKRVENTFAHRTQSSIGGFPSLIRIEDNGSRTITQSVVGFGFPISVQGDIEAIVRTDQDLNSKGITYVRVTAGQYHYVNGKWDDTVDFLDRFNLINLTRETKTAVPLSSNFDYRYIGDLSISTDDIPSDATAGVEVEFRGARLGVSSLGESGVSAIDFKTSGSVQSDECNFTNIRFKASFEEGDSQSIQYELRNSASYTLEIDYPTTYFGDGPNESSPSALRHATAFDDLTSGTWQRRGGGAVRPFHTNLLHEILDPRRGARRVLNGVIKGDWKSHKVLSYDSTYFYNLGDSFDGYTGNWSVQVVEISITDNEEAIQTLVEQRIQSLITNTARVSDLTTRDLRKIQNLTNRVGITTVAYDNETTTSLQAQLDVYMRTGIEYWVINEAELDWRNLQAGIYSVIPTGIGGESIPWMSGSIPIEEQIINAPSGSLIVKAPGQMEANDSYYETKDREFDTRLDTLDTNLASLDGDLTTLEANLATAQGEIDNLNDVQLPALDAELTTLDGYFNDPSTIPIGYSFFDGIVSNAVWAQTGVFMTGWFNSVFANSLMTNRIVTNHITSGAIISNKIGAGEILTINLGANQVTANKIDVADLAADSAFIAELMTQNLTITSTGKITNTAEDFLINTDGFIVKDAGIVVGGSLPFGRSYTVVDEANPSNSIVGVFGDSSLNGYLAMPKGDKKLIIQAGIISSPAQSPGADLQIRATRDILIDIFRHFELDLPTTNPGGTNRLWNDAGTVKIT